MSEEELETSREVSFPIGKEAEDFSLNTYEENTFLPASTFVVNQIHRINATSFPGTFNEQSMDSSSQSPNFAEISWFPSPDGETVATELHASDDATYEEVLG